MKLWLDFSFYLLTFIVFLIIFLNLIVLGFKKRLTLSFSSFDRYLLLILASFWLSTIFSPDRVSGLLSPLGTLTITVLFFWYFILLRLPAFLKEKINLLLTFSLSFFLLFLIFNTFSLGQKQKPVVLPARFGYLVALDTFKSPKQALLGYGVGNFTTAFNLNRPFLLNLFDQGRQADTRFAVSSNLPFHLTSENGLLGILSWLLLLWVVFKQKRQTPLLLETKLALLGFWAIVLISLIFPPHPLMWFYLFTFLAFLASHSGGVKAKTWDFSVLGKGGWVISGTLIFLISLTVYLAGRAFLAEFYYQKSLAAIFKNEKVLPVYNLQNNAIKLNPYLPVYHQALSQTLVFWGTSLAQKENLTDKEHQDASTLLQQAITQAQQAVALNPQDASYWENLGKIYSVLISTVSGADSWTETAYTNAVALDPNNPNTHFALGGVLLTLSKYDQAQKQFEITTTLASSFPNGFYNLYFAQKQQGLYKQALDSLNQTIKLLPKNSPDLDKVQKEKEQLEKVVGGAK